MSIPSRKQFTIGRRPVLMAAAGLAGAAALDAPVLAGSSGRAAHLPIPEPVPDYVALGKTISIPTGEVWYCDSGGDGDVVVLLHPATGSGLIWENQWLALVEAGYRVIAYSRIGHWGSDPIDPDNPGHGAQDLKDLLDLLGIERFHGVGTAAGGLYITDFAVSWSEMLLSMTSACAISGFNDPAFLAKLDVDMPPDHQSMPEWFKEVGPLYRSANPEGLKKWIDLEHIGRSRPARFQPKINGISWEEASRITAPVMLMVGGADLYVAPALMRMAVPHFRSCEFHVIPNAGHSAYWETPREFNSLLLNFLQEHRLKA